MHILSVLSVSRALNRLHKLTNKDFSMKVSEKEIEILDDNGDVFDKDVWGGNLVRRLNELSAKEELNNLLLTE